MWENNFKSFFDHNLRLIFEIFEKKKCDFMCYTWYETIQHWHHWHCCWWQKTLDPRLVLQKISQYCPETRKLRVSTVRKYSNSWRHIKFSFSLFWNWSEFCGTLQKGLGFSAQPFKHRQCNYRQISLFKNLFIINVLGLKNSTDFKESMQ